MNLWTPIGRQIDLKVEEEANTVRTEGGTKWRGKGPKNLIR
jgi:hypothetical protein